MGQRVGQSKRLPQGIHRALASYVAELEKLYPEGGKNYQLVPWPEYGEGSYLIKVPRVSDEAKWLEISEQMAEVGVHILEESDQLFILTVA